MEARWRKKPLRGDSVRALEERKLVPECPSAWLAGSAWSQAEWRNSPSVWWRRPTAVQIGAETISGSDEGQEGRSL